MEISLAKLRDIISERSEGDLPKDVIEKLTNNCATVSYIDNRLQITIKGGDFGSITVQLERLRDNSPDPMTGFVGYIIDDESLNYINKHLPPKESQDLLFSFCVFTLSIGSKQKDYNSFELRNCIFMDRAQFIESRINKLCLIKGCIFNEGLNLFANRFNDGFVFTDNVL